MPVPDSTMRPWGAYRIRLDNDVNVLDGLWLFS
jgi:hypothetical protein